MIITNMDFISYICMILTAIINPGIVTLIYPFSVFGYAIFEETRPKPSFWYFILAYTQVIVVIEFIFSLHFWQV